jgi:ArsR family transcriptional regulator
MEDSSKYSIIFKALSDVTRLKIVEMLSCGEMCACDILEYFKITQPTLSYHLKMLTDSKIVLSRKEGTWIMYSLNHDLINEINVFWNQLTVGKEDCICHEVVEGTACE